MRLGHGILSRPGGGIVEVEEAGELEDSGGMDAPDASFRVPTDGTDPCIGVGRCVATDFGTPPAQLIEREGPAQGGEPSEAGARELVGRPRGGA